MLYVDRSITEGGFEAINRFLTNLPHNGIFSEDAISEFHIDRPYKFDVGDRVSCESGPGSIAGVGNDGYWVVSLDDGSQKIIHESELKLL
jgi:hypothetical protein